MKPYNVSFRPRIRFSWFWRPMYGAFLIALLVFLLVAGGVRLGVLELAELQGFDLLVRLRSPELPLDRVVIVDFDDATITSLGTFPIPRGVLAEALEDISAAQPDLVGVDLLLSERRTPEEDRRLETSLKKSRNVILAETFETERIPRTEPLPEFRDAALAIGFVNLPLDSDGVVRRMFLSLSWPGFTGNSLALTLAMNHLGRPLEVVRPGEYRLGSMRVHLADAATQTTLLGAWDIPPAGRILSARRLLSGDYDPRWFRQKIVLIGQSSAAGKDRYTTPLFRSRRQGEKGTLLSGVELHALALSNLLRGETVQVPAVTSFWIFNCLLIWIVCAGVISFRPLGSVCAAITLGGGVFALAVFLFAQNHLWLKFISTEVGMFLALTCGLGYRFLSEQRVTTALEHELALARAIQQALLPDSLPQPEGLEIAARYESSSQVGGDYYDFLTLGSSRLLFIVADVQGHGVSSALIMSNIQATLRALVSVQTDASPAHLVSALDKCLIASARGKKFVTLFLGVLDLPGRELRYVNAGHVVPLVLRSSGETVELTEGGPVIGLGGDLFAASGYETGLIQLRPGDLLLAFTDGITEASNPRGEEYNPEGILRVAGPLRGQPARRIVDAVFDDVAQFSQGGPRQDDKVLVAIQVTRAAKP